jgi:type I restriction enzyme M protein
MASHTDIIRKFDSIIKSMRAGWVNNPIDYIEQISYFLFLKLLDEREEQGEQIAKLTKKEYDGVFAGDNEKYRFRNWAHSLNGDELRLFIESEIFPFIRNLKSLRPEERQYFRNAYLKIDEPSTLKGVVENIASMDFSSLDTIDKGDLYEHMLSQISKSWKNGQFRTPRHIIDMMTSIVDPDIMETVYDPSVGTAWFIISTFQHILKKYSDPATMKHKTDDRGVDYTLWTGDKLTETQSSFLYQKTFYGYDIDAHMVRFSIMNMILHGFTEGTNIRIKDTLGKNTDEQDKARQYDIIVANPPFSGTIDRSRIDSDDFPVASNSTEVLFLGHMIDKLRDGGRAAVIVPDGVVSKKNKDYISIRKYLMNKCTLQAVISLPSWVFNPYSWVKTNILIFQKWGKTDKVWFYDMHADGYDLGAQRRPSEESDIPNLLHRWEQIKQGKQPENDRSWCASKEEIEKNEWVLNWGKYKTATVKQESNFPYIKLWEVCEINPKKSEIKGKLQDTDTVWFLWMADVSESWRIIDVKKKQLSEVSAGFTYFADGDILFAKITPCMENGKWAVVSWMPNKVWFWSTEFHVLRCWTKVLPWYVFQILQSKKLREEAKNNMTGSAWQKRVPTSFLENYEIPLPPLDVQQDLVNKLNAQQAIIDSIDTLISQLEEAGIDESLFDDIDEWVELGEVCEIVSWWTPSTEKEEYWKDWDICWVTLVDTKQKYLFDTARKITNEWLKNSSAKMLPIDTVLFSSRATIWSVSIAKVPVATNQWYKNFICSDTILPEYLYYVLKYLTPRIEQVCSGSTYKEVSKSQISAFTIPVPSLEKQETVATKLARQDTTIEHLVNLRNDRKLDIQKNLESIFS